MDATNREIETILDASVQHDASGVGHAWRTMTEADLMSSGHVADLATWLAEEEPEAGDETAIGGCRYRVAP